MANVSRMATYALLRAGTVGHKEAARIAGLTLAELEAVEGSHKLESPIFCRGCRAHVTTIPCPACRMAGRLQWFDPPHQWGEPLPPSDVRYGRMAETAPHTSPF